MLKKQNRLTSNFEFNVTKKYGQKYHFPSFTAYICFPTNYLGPSKFGIIVGTSFHKNAVKRNYFKRVIRELIRINLHRFPDNLWVIIYPKNNCLTKKYEEISTEFDQVVSKISFAH